MKLCRGKVYLSQTGPSFPLVLKFSLQSKKFCKFKPDSGTVNCSTKSFQLTSTNVKKKLLTACRTFFNIACRISFLSSYVNNFIIVELIVLETLETKTIIQILILLKSYHLKFSHMHRTKKYNLQ